MKIRILMRTPWSGRVWRLEVRTEAAQDNNKFGSLILKPRHCQNGNAGGLRVL